MLSILLIAAASQATAVDAERAFAARAQKAGQWTAFRETADATAVMFTPQAVWARDFLKDRKDPRTAVRWWPTRSFVSCDGDLAVNTGAWRSGAAHGSFVTIWARQKNGGWKWSVDGVDTLRKPLAIPARPAVRKASCTNLMRIPRAYAAVAETTAELAGKPPADAGQGRSADGTLTWSWTVAKDGARKTETKLWNGARYVTMLDEKVPAPKP